MDSYWAAHFCTDSEEIPSLREWNASIVFQQDMLLFLLFLLQQEIYIYAQKYSLPSDKIFIISLVYLEGSISGVSRLPIYFCRKTTQIFAGNVEIIAGLMYYCKC